MDQNQALEAPPARQSHPPSAGGAGRPSSNRRLRAGAAPVALAFAVVYVLTGCSGSSTAGGDTTCNEWLELELPVEEALDSVAAGGSNLSEEQQEILKDALAEQELATDDANVTTASVRVLEFCAPDGTGTRPNAESGITGALR